MKNQNLFDKYRDGNHWENHPTMYAKEFANFLRFNDKKFVFMDFWAPYQIVDLGCGSGRDVHYFRSEEYIKAIGLDKNTDCVKKTELPVQDVLSVQDIENLSFEDNSQYAYFCINVLHYVDAPKVLGEIYRTLKQGGYAFIHFNLLIFDQNYSIDYHQKKSDVYELLKDFEIVEEKIFLREDKLPTPHTHHIMQVIIKKN